MEMKDWLDNIENLLIEENCHTQQDVQVIESLKALVDRDTPMIPYFRVIKNRLMRGRCVCGKKVFETDYFCSRCGKRLNWGSNEQ